MSDPEAVVAFPEPRPAIPESIRLSTENATPRLSPNEMRKLREQTGMDLMEMMGEGSSSEDRTQAIVWARLRRDGLEVTWEEAGEVVVDWVLPDPT